MQFFAHLTLFKTVSVASFLELLQSFLVVLDEPGVSYERMEAAALCVGDGLLRVRIYQSSVLLACLTLILPNPDVGWKLGLRL